MTKSLIKTAFVFIGVFLFTIANVSAAIEEISTKSADNKVDVNQTLIVKDDKYTNPDLDPSLSEDFSYRIDKVFSLSNRVVLKVLEGSPVDFKCTLFLRVEYYSELYQTTPDVDEPVELTVNYSAVSGVSTKIQDVHSMDNARYVKVTVTEIWIDDHVVNSAPFVELSNNLLINRRYRFEPDYQIPITGSISQSNTSTSSALDLSWTLAPGAEEYDVEWAVVDEGGLFDLVSSDLKANKNSLADISKVFRNNANRITTHRQDYSLSLVYKSKFILVRIRPVQYGDEGLRREGAWSYRMTDLNFAIWNISDLKHHTNLNWQYTSAYAEEGKKKEVISYFDGTLRSRQTVTLNSSDRVAVVQENIYDEFGRQTASILPAPIKEEAADKGEFLHYFKKFNLKEGASSTDNVPFSSEDISISRCDDTFVTALKKTSGASRYYSDHNQFLTDNSLSNSALYNKPFNKYIPDANKYPISVTEYTPDNTGRIQQQGGVGEIFQPHNVTDNNPSRTTRYYYGLPAQWELDRLFGNDVGNADHYLKNMVVDPNGQVSLSYLNASGKTIATALTGVKPSNGDGIEAVSSPGLDNNKEQILIRSSQFAYDANSMSLKATASYLNSIKNGTGSLTYDIDRIVHKYGGESFQICSNCYYELSVSVKDECGVEKSNFSSIVNIGSTAADKCEGSEEITNPITVNFDELGLFTVSFEFKLSKNVLEKFTNDYITKGLKDGYLKNELYYILKRIDELKLESALDNCKTAREILGTQTKLEQVISLKLQEMGFDVPSSGVEAEEWQTWLSQTYTRLAKKRDALELACKIPSGSPCEKYRTLMLEDLTPPYGQYALFNDVGAGIDLQTNVISTYFRTIFPTNGTESGEDIITLDDGKIINPYSINVKWEDLITYWKPEWSERFLQWHPEKCKLDKCGQLSEFHLWDEGIKRLNSPPAGSNSTAAWLVYQDKMFINGANSAAEMISDLNNFSSKAVKFSNNQNVNLNAKNIKQYVDYQLYCSEETMTEAGWNNCSPDAACRMPDREWQAYRDLYFELKEKYYKKLYESCGGCPIGDNTPISVTNAGAIADYSIEERTFCIEEDNLDPESCYNEAKAFRIKYTGTKLPGAARITLSYPLAFANVNLPTSVVMLPQSQISYSAEFLIPAELSVSAIKINSVILLKANCDNKIANGEIEATEEVEGDTFRALAMAEGEPFFDYDQQSSDGYVEGRKYFDECYWDPYSNSWVQSQPPYCPPVQKSFLYKIIYGHCDEPPALPDYSVQGFYSKFTVQSADPKQYSNVWVLRKIEDQSLQTLNGPNDYNFSRVDDGAIIVSVTPKSYLVPGKENKTPEVTLYYFFKGILSSTIVYVDPFTHAGYAEFSEGNANHAGCSDYIFLAVKGRMTPVTGESAECSMYRNKIARFQSVEYVIPTDISSGEDLVSQQGITKEIKENVDVKAENWMLALNEGLESYTTDKKDELRRVLVSIAETAGDITHIGGASTVPQSRSSLVLYSSFELAIKGVLGIQDLTPTLNPWLLSDTYPYYNQPSVSRTMISRTNDVIRGKITALKTESNTSTTQGFYNFLVNKFGASATNIKVTELEALINSEDCNGLLPYDIALPVYLDEKKGYITWTEYNNSVTAFQEKIPAFAEMVPKGNLEATDAYRSLLATYLNHSFGFTLGSSQYEDFEAQCIAATGDKPVLCNLPLDEPLNVDLEVGLKSIAAAGYEGGHEYYKQAIAEARAAFKADYVSYCSAADALVNLTYGQEIYHYTLYYYDQAGNLIRTVPPEGVKVLGSGELAQIEAARKNNYVPCVAPSDYPAEKKAEVLAGLSTTLSSIGTGQSIEMWLYNAASSPQVMITSSDNKYMLHTCINNKLLSVEVYSLNQEVGKDKTIDIVRSNQAVFKIPKGAGQSIWTHLVIEGTNLASGTITAYIDNKLATPGIGPFQGCGWSIIGNSSPIKLPETMASIKHVRFYKRELTCIDRDNNYKDACLFPYDKTNMVVWSRFNIPLGEDGQPAVAKVESKYDPIYPNHALISDYKFNSMNQVYEQYTPDSKKSQFWYDKLGRLAISQNAQQNKDGAFSYTRYDKLGRVFEVGKKTTASTVLNDSLFVDNSTIDAFIDGTGSKTEITQTIYDKVPLAANYPGVVTNLGLENSRKRVTASIYRETPTDPAINATYYSYDISGNVKTLWQQIKGFGHIPIYYEYDLVSGKVNFVSYSTQFHYQYKYDAENRLTDVYTGIDAAVDENRLKSTLFETNRKRNAHYEYYLHGPLARLEYGEETKRLQGLDYAYTLQGWLKSVNGQKLDPVTDMGNDGQNALIARDAFAYSLGYHTGDYKAISSTATALPLQVNTLGLLTGTNLYNGNIGTSTVAISGIGQGSPVGYSYRYDQLSRLTQMFQHQELSGSSLNKINNNYHEEISYDANGNIQKFKRHGADGAVIDELTYGYEVLNNRLQHNKLLSVSDTKGKAISGDIGNASYTYDDIGNLKTDLSENISNINWNVYGKIKKIEKSSGNIEYSYDAAGNRVSKTSPEGTTWYVRDGQGNTLGVHNDRGYWEQQLYGSSRLGSWKQKLTDDEDIFDPWNYDNRTFYELSNHLGNVLAVVSDKRVLGTDGKYEASVVSAQDYYPFGMIQPERSVGSRYRYGFNGKENDDDVKGVKGSQQDYGMRIYDPRLGRFLSVDPIAKQYPWYTPYQFAGNMPIQFIDLDGLEPARPGSKAGDYAVAAKNGTNDWFGWTWELKDKTNNVYYWKQRNSVQYKGGDVYNDNNHGDKYQKYDESVQVYPMIDLRVWKNNDTEARWEDFEAGFDAGVATALSGNATKEADLLKNKFYIGNNSTILTFNNKSEMSKQVSKDGNFLSVAQQFERKALEFFRSKMTLDGFTSNLTSPYLNETIFLNTVFGGTKQITAEIRKITADEIKVRYTVWDRFSAGTDDAVKWYYPGLPSLYWLQNNAVHFDPTTKNNFKPFYWNVIVDR